MKNDKEILDSVAPERRAFVKRLLQASTFAVPLALGAAAIGSRTAHAQAESQSTGGASSSTNVGGGAAQSSAQAIPEPATLGLLGLGLAGAALEQRRRAATRDDDAQD